MSLKLVTAPTAPPVTLAEAKAHLRVLTDDEDSLIEALIETATGQLDGRKAGLGRALMTQTWVWRIDGFPWCHGLELPFPPLQQVESITYVDGAGVEQTLDPAVYVVDPDSDPGRVDLAFGYRWPVTRAERNAVRLQFIAGFGDDAADVPHRLRQAILLMVADGYRFRETVVAGAGSPDAIPMSLTVQNLIGNYRTSIAS